MSLSHGDRILVVDDDREACELFAMLLTAWGYTPLIANSCAIAVSLCRVAKVHCAVLDHHLPDGTALTLIPQLRALGEYAPPGIFVISGADMRPFDALREAGIISGYLQKPIKIEDLEHAMDTCAHEKREPASA